MLKVTLIISSFLRIEVMTIKLKRTLIMARLISRTTIKAPYNRKYIHCVMTTVFVFLPLFMWDHSLTFRVILRKLSNVSFISIFLQLNKHLWVDLIWSVWMKIFLHHPPIRLRLYPSISKPLPLQIGFSQQLEDIDYWSRDNCLHIKLNRNK